jgi:uncharacterized membrane protein
MEKHDPAFTKHLNGEPPFDGGPPDEPLPPRRWAFPKWPLVVALAGALLGAAFAALSTTDFMQHLDRQVHAIHCSFLPGAAKEIAESGCRTVMMSPYSSFFRETLWGGVPISLWALAVFAFLAYRAALMLWRGQTAAGETKVLLAAAALPVLASVVYGALAVVKLDALCKVCVGIYAASAICFVGALLAHRAPSSSGEGRFVPALFEGAGLVAALTLAYILLVPKPDPIASMRGCGSLVRADDAAGVMIPLSPHAGETSSVEVLDPLCPSCKAFDARLAASSLGEHLDLKGVLFPLDSTCNWMVTETIHPGACAVSEAVLCAAGLRPGAKDAASAGAVLQWAFARQAELRALAAKDEGALRAQLEREFPAVKGCLGSAVVKSKLTKSLRWAVANAIPVLTPQLFVGGSRMCDEDTDLGLEYTLTRMLSPAAEQDRARRRAAEPPRAPPPRPAVEDVQAAAAVPPVVEVTAKPGAPAPSSPPAPAPAPSVAPAPPSAPAPAAPSAVETPSPSPSDEKVQK